MRGLLAVAATALSIAGAARAAPVDVYGRLPAIEDVRLSPSGAKLATTGAVGDARMITVSNLTTGGEPLVIKAGNVKLSTLEWVDDEHLLFTLTFTATAPPEFHGRGRKYSEAYVYDLPTHKLNDLTPRKGLELILGTPEIREVGGRRKVFFLNLDLIAPGAFMGAAVNIAGNLYDVENGALTLDRNVPLPADPVPTATASGLRWPLRDSRTGQTVGSSETGEKTTYQFVDAGLQAAWPVILKAFAGEQVDFVSASIDRKKVAVRVFGPKTGNAYFVVDLTNGHADLIGEAYGAVTQADIAPLQLIHYRATDGLDLKGYLTLPPGRTAKALPTIVLVHDGPEGRDDWGFDWVAQALAAQGYAVLQPQFRGSKGFESGLTVKGVGEWGRKMQTDLSDGLAYLTAQGIADPRRACIMGANYGGYAALAGVTLQSGIYRCAVSVNGIADPKALAVSAHSLFGAPGLAPMIERFMGVTDARDAKLIEISPVAAAAMASAPVLLLHADNDTITPVEQSKAMADALRKAGKPVQLVVLNREDHGLSHSQTRLQMLRTAVQFLETNNPPH